MYSLLMFCRKNVEIAFTSFGGQVQFEKSMVGRLDNLGAGYSNERSIKYNHLQYLLVGVGDVHLFNVVMFSNS